MKLLFISFLSILLISCKSAATLCEHNAIHSSEKSQFDIIPLQQYTSGHLRIDGFLNGLPIKLLLDTGSSKSFIDTRHTNTYSLTPEFSTQTASGIDGSVRRFEICTVDSLVFSNVQLEKVIFGLMDLNHINRALINAGQESIDGIIGADLLKEYNGIIDYQRSTLSLSKNSSKLP